MAKFRTVKVLRLSWPVAAGTFAALMSGDATALETDPWFAKLLGPLRASNPLGDFGAYQAVAEVSPCWELFKPTPEARPTLGEPDAAQVSTNLMVTVHVLGNTSEEQFEALLDALMAGHPWEVPVIEVSEVRLLVRDDQADR
jgi:hypothetical protein